MTEQELKSLKNEVLDASYQLKRAIYDASTALENLEAFYEDDSDAKDQFAFLIESGFIPGQLMESTKMDHKIRVLSYTYVARKDHGAGVVFEYL